MVVIWATLVVALVVHEGSHYLLLRWAGLHPRPSFHFPGLGWRFNTGHASAHQLMDIWLVGPIMESLVWATAALLFSAWAWELLLVMGIELGTNLVLPGSDGRRVLRLWRSTSARGAGGASSRCGGGVPDSTSGLHAGPTVGSRR